MMRLATLRHIGRAMCIGASIRRVRKSPCDGLSAQSSHLPLSAPIPHIWLSHEQNCSLVAADRWPPSVATTGSRSAVPFSMRAPRNPRNSSSALKSLPKIHAPPVEAVEIRCKSKSESSSVESHSARVDANHPHPDQRAAPNLSARINEDSVTRNHVSATRAAVAIKKVKGEAVAGAASAAKKAIIDAAKKSQVGATSEAAAILKQSQPTASSVSSSLEQRIEIIEREIDKIGDEIAHVNSTLDQLLARRGTATDQGRLERDIANRRSETTQLWAKQSQLRTRKKELRNELLHVLKSAYLQRLADPLQLGIFEWLERLPGFNTYIFTRQPLTSRGLGDRFARDDSFRAAYSLFETHIAHGEAALLRKPIRPDLMATVGAPGSGKSFLLDELAAFRPDDVEQFASVKRRVLFHESNVLALNVTFNAATPFIAELESCAEFSLSARILFQYFRTLVAMDFPSFCQTFRRFPIHGTGLSMTFVAKHYFARTLGSGASLPTASALSTVSALSTASTQTPLRLLFIGIDELTKYPKFQDLVSEVGYRMDCGFQFDLPNGVGKCPMILLPVVTSLSAQVVQLSVKVPGSNRSFDWIPLGPLHGAARHIARLDPRLSAAGDPVQKALRILCTDLGEHGRMLELLVAHLRHGDGANLRRLVAEGTDAVPRILHAMEDSCRAYLSNLDSTPLSIVSAAILGREVDRHENPDGCDLTFGELHMRGTYISSKTPHADHIHFTPVLSPFQLLFWARSIQTGVDSSDRRYKVAEVLLRVMRRDFILTGVPIEHVICDIEYLRRLLFPAKCELSYMYQFDYDDHCLLPESTKGVLHLTVQNVGVELSQFRRHVVVDDDFSKPITKSKLVSQPRFPGAHILDALPAGTKVPRVVLAAPRQPFFNVLIRQPVADSKDGQASEVTILLQCARSESRQKPSDKRTLWVGDFDASVRKFQKSSAAAASRSGTGSPRRREPCDDKSSSRDDEDTDESSHLASDPWASSGRLQVCIAAQSLSACSLPAARARSHFRRVSVLPLDLAALKIIYGPTIARSHAFAVHPDHSEEELAHASRGRYEFAQLQRIYDFRQ